MSVLLERYSCRNYTDEPVTEEQIKSMLTAAMQAPSAKNQQPWEFIVIDDADLLEKLSKMSPGAWMLADVNKAIAVIMTESDKSPHMRPQDCAAATQNILLDATMQGLGACWIGVYPLEERMEYANGLLGVEENTVFSLIAIGHPEKDKTVAVRYDESRVHYNKVKK